MWPVNTGPDRGVSFHSKIVLVEGNCNSRQLENNDILGVAC